MNQRALALRFDGPADRVFPKVLLGSRTPGSTLPPSAGGPASLASLLSERSLSELLQNGSVAVPRRLGERALFSPLREFLSRPGKQFRRLLVERGWQMGGADRPMPSALGDLLELVHAGSLIIDDIEDDAIERRGRAALHRLHGIPTALNGGNFLYFMPLLLLRHVDLSPSEELAIYRHFTTAMVRCHYGQGLDLTVRVWELPRRDVRPAVAAATRFKTGSLAELAMTIGAVAADADPSLVGGIGRLGRDLGIALQMLDDLSGITNPNRLHKGREDVIWGRLTWPWAWAADRLNAASYGRLRRLARQAAQSSTNGPSVESVIEQLRSALDGRGTWLVRAFVRTAMARARRVVGNTAVLTSLEKEISSLEKSYGSGA